MSEVRTEEQGIHPEAGAEFFKKLLAHRAALADLARAIESIAEVMSGARRWLIIEGEALDVMRQIPSGVIDALITDPPYSSGGFTRGDRMLDASTKYSKGQLNTFGGDNRDQRAFFAWCCAWLAEGVRITRVGAPFVQFSDWRQVPVTTDAFQGGGLIWRGTVPWPKESPRPQMGRFAAAAEYAIWGTNGPADDSEEVGCLKGVFYGRAPMGADRVHLTQKPVEVMEEACRIIPRGQLILDPFAGSGSTGVAALRLGRKFIGIERDPHYASVARDRLAAEAQGISIQAHRAGQTALFDEPTRTPDISDVPGDAS